MLLNEWELSEIIEATFTSFPIIIKANGEPLIDYTIYGNTTQSGTPSPDNLIMPQGTGERTGNLWDESTIEVGGLDVNTGAEVANSSRRRSGFIKVTPSTAYTLTRVIDTTKSNLWVIGYDANKNVISDSTGTRPTVLTSIDENAAASSFDTTPSTEYIRWYVTANGSYSDIMLNTGSTALPYEPYGYKIPISSANTTTPVYLGEVQTTRKIKKIIFDGQDDAVTLNTVDTGRIVVRKTIVAVNGQGYCSHLGNNVTGVNKFVIAANTIYLSFALQVIGGNTLADVNAYFAAQYAAGTPVTVWYVLATETTGIVNEPLMKIGDYTDTLNMEQAGVSIPTLNKPNNTVIDVETDLKPSKMYVKYNGEGTRVYITSDNKLYITSNNEIYVLKR
jgi:hypothetical protein